MECLNRILCFFLISSVLFSQNNLENFLTSNDENYLISSTFMSTRIINAHSVELFDKGAMDMRISHRFGTLNTGFYELFGLDQATIRIGFEYGLNKNTMIGFGRSSYKKNYDFFTKFALVRQRKKQIIPVSAIFFSSVSIESIKKNFDNYPLSGRVSYCNQLLLASKLNKQFSIQLMPTYVHKNMVDFTENYNDIFLIGLGFKYNFTKSSSINFEYFYRTTGKNIIYSGQNYFYNSFSVGFDIQAGGHVFQLHLTNSLPMYEVGFLTETNRSWLDGGVHFGFNISREFTLK